MKRSSPRKRTWLLPDGKPAKDKQEYTDRWTSFGISVARRFGGKLYSFSHETSINALGRVDRVPDLTILIGEELVVHLDIAAARALLKNSNPKEHHENR